MKFSLSVATGFVVATAVVSARPYPLLLGGLEVTSVGGGIFIKSPSPNYRSGAGVAGSGAGEGVSADACPAIMITTMSDAAIARLPPVAARQRENRRRLTRTPKMTPERV